MNPRERYIRALLFEKVDKVPFIPGYPRESTLAAWHRQGLPEGEYFYDYLLRTLGIEPEPTQPQVGLGVDLRMIPQFEEKVVEHKPGAPGRPGSYVVQDWMGNITEISDEYDYTYIRNAKDFVTRNWHRFAVQTHQDWEDLRKRYDVDAPGRFPADFEERCRAMRDRDYVVTVGINGPFWQLREWVGLENLCMWMVEQPDFVQEMIDFWTDFVLQALRPILARVQIDSVHFSEDMAYKAHSMISPRMSRKFLLPSYQKWIAQVRANGCRVVDMDSDGYVAELIQIWIDAGINVCDPIEVAAGNDIVAFRRQYGSQMAYYGGIDKRAIAAGGQTMRAEVLRVVPPLLEMGGFIPSCDHGVPSDISWPDYVEYSRLLAKLTGWL